MKWADRRTRAGSGETYCGRSATRLRLRESVASDFDVDCFSFDDTAQPAQLIEHAIERLAMPVNTAANRRRSRVAAPLG